MAIPERNVILAGVRDLEPYQRERLDGSDLLSVPGSIDPSSLESAVAELSSRVSHVYLHFDLDTIDVAAAALTAYDPASDADGRALVAGQAIAREIARGVRITR